MVPMSDYRARLASNDRERLAKQLGAVEQNLDVVPGMVLKSRPEEMISVGVLYLPDRVDAQGEWASEKTLRSSLEKFLSRPIEERPVFLHHDPSRRAGSVISGECLWDDAVVGGVQLPRGTVVGTVRYEPWAWELVKRGDWAYSVGGTARRRRAT